VFPHSEAVRLCAVAQRRQVATYLDGARLWNAAVATDSTPADLAAPYDLVSVAFSKGLGAPAGSALAGSHELIGRAVRSRRMLGGAMRQIGIFAAAAVHAIDHNMDRLVEDHANARRIAEILAENQRIVLDPSTVQTNILVFELTPDAPDAPTVVASARERGVLIFAFGPRTIRVVTHLDLSREQCERAAIAVSQIVGR
jgi:threonine aldolase